MKAAVEEWGVEYEDVQLDDGMRPALLLKGAKDPRGRVPSRDKVVKEARAKVLKRRGRGAWPRYFWRDDKERKPGAGELRYKTYASEVKEGVVPTTFWARDEYEIVELDPVSWTHRESGTSDIGVKELNAVVGRGHGFDTVKPLLLFQKIITLWSPTDGLIMDPFAGSGTTGHSILKLNKESGSTRRFILLEQGRPENGDSYARTLLADRLRRVVTGNWKSGKQPPLGNGFSFRALAQKVDAGVLLRMERDEMVETVIASHFDATRRRGDQLIAVESTGRKPYRYLVAKNADDEGFFLVWDGPNKNTDLTEAVYEVCAKEAASAGLKTSPYHVYARLYRYQTEGVVFLQIPDRILADFGMDIRSEPFTENDNDLDT
jgi:adenine-specific DNA-methyltransferase